MCFFGGAPKVPDAPPPPPAPAVIPPPPAPSPVVQSQQVSAQTAASERQKRINQTRYGLASTIKTGPRGIVGQGPELQPGQTGRTTLG